MSKPRYQVIKGSQSGHCCFDFTVVDTTKPVMIHGRHYEGQFEALCECFDQEPAQQIADALNTADATEGYNPANTADATEGYNPANDRMQFPKPR